MLDYNSIIKEENLNLREKSEEVQLPLSEEDLKTILDLNEYLENGYDEVKSEKYNIRPGVGIAAVQIDVLKKMFVILCYDEVGELHHYGVINPKIISHSEELTYLESGEGCLSVNRTTEGYVHRPRRITARCTLLNFEDYSTSEVTLKLKGYMAIVFQHEYDHLFGKLFIDRINKNNPFYNPANSHPVIFKELFEDEEEHDMNAK
jgi:peptide deformylase